MHTTRSQGEDSRSNSISPENNGFRDTSLDQTQSPANGDALRQAELGLGHALMNGQLDLEQFEALVAKHVHRPDYAFNPSDSWAQVLREGLLKLDVPERGLGVEVGVGLGVNVAMMLMKHPHIRIIGSDLDGRVTRDAQANVELFLGHAGQGRFLPLEGNQDLLTGLPKSEYRGEPVDFIFGCLPQVQVPLNKALEGADALAHYYRPQPHANVEGHYQELYEKYDEWDLGLNARLLQQASQVLVPGGSVVLNLAGRTPFPVLTEMFRDYGFEPRILHERMIQQDRGTNIGHLAEDERRNPGKEFVFYQDSKGETEPINAKEGALLMHELGRPIYHKLFVLHGTLNLV